MSRACEACGRPLDTDHPHLCGHCAATIDRDTDAMLERDLFDPGGSWE
jgi:predicted amidophosphoribosyltransferase